METIRIFLSSPGDLTDERRQCAEVVEELNATLRALVPGNSTELELIRWETHTHPAVGDGPQDVVDTQLGTDFDIFVGMMWTRFGTPTHTAGSGTEAEFRTALRGWQKRRRPSQIMFYFCNAQISAQHAIEHADQLTAIKAFRLELETTGLIGYYDDRGRFGDILRRDLVRVLSNLLQTDQPPAKVAERIAARTPSADADVVRAQIAALADEYDRVRHALNSSPERTSRMEVLVSNFRTLAQPAFALLPELQTSSSPGHRLAAISALQVIPDPRQLDWLIAQLSSEHRFIAYHAARGLLMAARELADLDLVEAALREAAARTSDLRPETDRAATLRLAVRELEQRRAQSAGGA